MTADELRDSLRRYGVTQQAFAERCGVTLRAVGRWTQGSRSIPAGAQRLARLMQRRGYWTKPNRTADKVERPETAPTPTKAPPYRGEFATLACRDCGATNPAYCARWCPGRTRDSDALTTINRKDGTGPE